MDKDKVKSFTQHVFRDMAGAMTAGLAYLGTRTGLFNAMQGRGPMQLQQVVEASGLQARYVEEWLKGMVCAGYLEYEPGAQTYELPEEHAFMLASEGTDHFVGGLFHMAPVLLGVATKVARAFEEGGGVPFADYGEEGVTALNLVNRGTYENRFASYWLQAMPEVVQKLETGGRALDFGCGTGHVSVALAKAFPESTFLGIDIDAGSIERAIRNAKERGVEDRARFEVCALDALAEDGGFDLITVCDCIHDLVEPVNTLHALKRRLEPDGTLFAIEPKAADRLEDNRHPIGAMFYGFSVFHCMTQSLAQGGPGLGTCMGPQQTESLLRAAGFTEFRALDIKSHVNSFYCAR